MRTKQEVISFLESKVGTKVPCKGTPSLDGQCVTLIKALMEFLGVPDPYKARGHAKTAISAYLSEGIADEGAGFLSVFSNKNMGGGYGHIWCNAGDGNGVFYESNGQKALIVTKGKTHSYDAVCNFDKNIKGESMSNVYKGYDLTNQESMKVAVDVLVRVQNGEFIDKVIYEEITSDLAKERQKTLSLQKERSSLQESLAIKSRDLEEALEKIADLESQPTVPVDPDMDKWELNGLVVVRGDKSFNYKLKE